MRTAIVTGANRGVGRGVAKRLAQLGYRTICTSRDEGKGKRTVDEIIREIGAKIAGDLAVHQLDVTDPDSIRRLYDFVMSDYGAADVLVNNAAVLIDRNCRVLQTSVETYRTTMETNVYGALLLCQMFIP